MNTGKPLITIITCTYNSALFLEECLTSVKKQDYQNIEHIFIDGQSIDSTKLIIRNYNPKAKIITQPPMGIYPAFNKGLQQATGDIIGFLHADDTFFDINCLQRIATAFIKNKSLDYYCSRMKIYDINLNESFAILGARPHHSSLKEMLYSPTYYAHPTYYCTASLINKIGPFNEKYQLAADIEWLNRLEQLKPTFFFDPNPLIKFRSGGSTAKHYFQALKEEFVIQKKYQGLSFKLLLAYSFHFFRRFIRYTLTILHLETFISESRKIILKNLNN